MIERDEEGTLDFVSQNVGCFDGLWVPEKHLIRTVLELMVLEQKFIGTNVL